MPQVASKGRRFLGYVIEYAVCFGLLLATTLFPRNSDAAAITGLVAVLAVGCYIIS